MLTVARPFVQGVTVSISWLKTAVFHIVWVLLNDKPVWYRLWSILFGAAPVLAWTLTFKKGVKLIPDDKRPPIHIDLLPKANAWLLSPIGVLLCTLSVLPLARLVYKFADENTSKSARPSRAKAFGISVALFPWALEGTFLLSKLPICNGLDLWAFASYGALHFASPIIAAWWIWGFGTQGAATVFGWNLSGLMTHLAFPNASPWFYDQYGVDAAVPDYSYPGSPAGLVRVDHILGTHIYEKAFGKGPVVFGAIPSLHAATAICCSLFVTRYSRGYKGLAFAWFYSFWMFWATQYLHHHWAIDLLVGSAYAALAFIIAERAFLRKFDRQHYEQGLTNGWDRLRWGIQDGTNDHGAVYPNGRTTRTSSFASFESGSTIGSSSGGVRTPPNFTRAGGYEAVRMVDEWEINDLRPIVSEEKV
ncbi:hypothetical protein OIO90_001656 [Microbotryomycetes sp. JL221]|nr:hypothetical protein OIO90_001656 [Microbotryomycetes sp. JL221]